MPPPSLPDLTLYLLPHRHSRLSDLLYISPHGGPIRTLPLILESGTRFYELHVPCLLLYDRFSRPTLTTTAMTRAEWIVLHEFVKEEGVLKVVLSPDGGVTDILGKVTVGDGEEGIEGGSVGVRFWWQEKEGGGKVGMR